ncbi:MAG: hypothetical protein HQK83_05165 [Fibrobacteria bacterium]|nr:hypothetical protein [Fibrobacteria bacterium]
MTEQSKITIAVRDAIVKVAEKGENITLNVASITRETVSQAMQKLEPQKEKIEKLVGEVMDGVKAASRESKVKLIEIMDHAIEGISVGARTANKQTQEYARKAAETTLGVLKETGETAKEVIKGVQEGVKEVVNKKKNEKLIKKVSLFTIIRRKK